MHRVMHSQPILCSKPLHQEKKHMCHCVPIAGEPGLTYSESMEIQLTWAFKGPEAAAARAQVHLYLPYVSLP